MPDLNYRLGIDIGTNSLGWSIIELDSKNSPKNITDCGVRIFADGRDEKSKATLKATRREARSARRRRDRFKQRQSFLINELIKAGLFPKEEQKQKQLQVLDPFELRHNALHSKLEPYHLGRALFHLNQRRGFNSNRKDRSTEKISGKVANSVRLLYEEMQLIKAGLSPEKYKALDKDKKKSAREEEILNRKKAVDNLSSFETLTFGSFLWERHKNRLPVRARPTSDGALYDFYPTRALLEDEFNKIWKAQSSYHPGLLTNDAKKRLHTAIFTQRKLKPQTLGKCAFLPDEDRTFRAMPSFQRFRIVQEVNNLDWTTVTARYFLTDHHEARDAIIDLHEKPGTKIGNVTFGKMRKIIMDMHITDEDFRFNFESEKRKGFDGNLTSNLLSSDECVGEQWHTWSLDKQDDFVALLLDDLLTDEDVHKRLQSEYGLGDAAAFSCMEAPLVEGTANLSLKASRILLERMKTHYCIQSDAVQLADKEVKEFVNPFTRSRDTELLNELPYYGEAFQDGRHIIPGDRLSEDKGDDYRYYGGVTNPTVHIALNQIRRVINELIQRYGRPDSISIELARDLPKGQSGLAEINRFQAANQKENERYDTTLKELGLQINRENRLRLQLWEGLDPKDPNGRACPYSGNKIGIADLFNGKTEIDHLIPYSISLDDGRANKVLCTRQANRDKGNQTPFEAFGEGQKGYDWTTIFENAKRLPASKQWRFREDALDILKRDHSDFTERHLNDTRYIGRLVREYLESICSFKNINVLTGSLTYMLRKYWGLNSILLGHNEPIGKDKPQRKSRDDHRHHAVDAIVIGMTNRALVQKVSTLAGRQDEPDIHKIYRRSPKGKSPLDPWDGFRDEAATKVRSILVSHRSMDRKEGQLHMETAYGFADKSILDSDAEDKIIKTQVVVRKPVSSLTKRSELEDIRDEKLKNLFLETFDKDTTSGVSAKESIQKQASVLNIKRLRMLYNRTVHPIRDRRTGKVYKAFWLNNNWATEIYEYPSNHSKAGQWMGVTIPRYEAHQTSFKAGVTKRPHPAAKMVMRLHINDCIEINENGDRRIMVVQKMSQGSLDFFEHFEANVPSRKKELVKNKSAMNVSANKLKILKARKIHISPSGKMNYEKRH